MASKSEFAKKYWQRRVNLKPGEQRAPFRFQEIRSTKQVAAIMGISRQRVQQIEREAIVKLRAGLREIYENDYKGR